MPAEWAMSIAVQIYKGVGDIRHCLRVNVNSVLCLQCGNWIHGRYARVNRVTQKFSRNFACRRCEGETVEREETICDEVVVVGELCGEVKTLREICDEVVAVGEFAYLGDRVSTGGGYKATVAVRTRCGWVMFRECGELLYGRRFPLRLFGAVCKSYVRPAILYGCDVWYLNESEIGILYRTERSMVRAMCGVQLKERTKSTD